jgi:uncharacterized protein
MPQLAAIPNVATTRAGRWPRRFKWAAASLAVVYLMVLVVLYLYQDALIFPGRTSQGHAKSALSAQLDFEVVQLRSADGRAIAAIFAPALSPGGSRLADAKTRPTVLYFYGNREYLADCVGKVEAIRRRGVNVFLPEYLGFGLSEGSAGEAGCLATADAAYEHVVNRPDVDATKLILGGFSMGGAVAIDLASRRPSAGLFVSCTFTSLGDMSARRYPLLPVRMLLRHRFLSLDKIGGVKVPILIADGKLDKMVPASMSEALTAAAGGPVTRITMKDAGHDDLVRMAPADPEVSAAFDRFLDRFR